MKSEEISRPQPTYYRKSNPIGKKNKEAEAKPLDQLNLFGEVTVEAPKQPPIPVYVRNVPAEA